MNYEYLFNYESQQVIFNYYEDECLYKRKHFSFDYVCLIRDEFSLVKDNNILISFSILVYFH